MTLSEVNEKLTRLTGENTTRYTNAQRAVDLTISLDKVASMIIDSQDDADFDDPNNTDFPIFYTDLVSGQRDYTFSISNNVLQYKEVEISWDGTTYYTAQRLDRSLQPFATGNADLLDSNYSKESPYYDIWTLEADESQNKEHSFIGFLEEIKMVKTLLVHVQYM